MSSRRPSDISLDPATIGHWARAILLGDLHARLPVPTDPALAAVAQELNRVGGQLQSMDALLRTQNIRIGSKTRSLDILYEVVASLGAARSRDEILENFLETLVELLDASAASIGLFAGKAGLKIAATHGDMGEIIERWVSADRYRSLSRAVSAEGKLKIHRVIAGGAVPAGPELIAVPVQHQDQVLGIFTVFLSHSSSEFGADFRDLLTSLGRHLGVALEKSRLDENARRLAVMEEREILRTELHDSLAQSLVSMRLQVKMLGETLHRKDFRAAQNEVRRLHMALEEAHDSLRELLASFRVKMDERGLLPAIEDTVGRFQQDTGITTFFQTTCAHVNLSPAQEVELYRIVQEALANIRRHSQAHVARIFLTEEEPGEYRLLVEDDGVGIQEAAGQSSRGEHLGMSIMHERSRRLGGQLLIDSEPGEGTRVQLRFQARQQSEAIGQ